VIFGILREFSWEFFFENFWNNTLMISFSELHEQI